MKANQKYNLDPYLDEFIILDTKQKTEFANKLAAEFGCKPEYIKKILYHKYKNRRVLVEKAKAYLPNYNQSAVPIIQIKEPDPATPETLVNADRIINREKETAKIANDKYKHLLKEYEILEKRFDFLIAIKENQEQENIIPKQIDTTVNHATPIILLSDWHFEERVDPATINGLNEYNLDIGQKRWTTCIQNSLKLVNLDRKHSEIKNLVVWLGGDFITGFIHEELAESNYLSPTQASRFAKKNIIAALEFYIQYGKFDSINVVCSFGNHGRTTQRKRHSTAYKNSFEWMIYHDVADYFKDNSKIRFTIPDGYFTYIRVYEFMCRFWHGDTIQYQGGIGGLTIPLIKAIHRYNLQIPADYNFMGHYHQLFQATKDCIVNGSGIGFNPYAQNIGASPERPMQSYCLVDQKRGLTIKAPIFCE